MRTYRISWVNFDYSTDDPYGIKTVQAASPKNALRMMARKMHRGAPLTFKPNGVASTSQLILTLEA